MLSVQKQVTVFEFGYLGVGDKAKYSDRIEEISASAYKYLKELCACEKSESRFLRPRFIDNCDVLQVKNYAGVLFTPDGTQIEVLPKVAKKNSGEHRAQHAQDSLLNMLKTLKSFRHLKTNNANLAKNKMPLLEVFISQFLSSVNELIKRGMRSDYVRCEDNLAFLKGKLLVGKQVQHNFINKHKFYVEYDEYLQDRPVNRLIHSALKKVSGYSRSANNQKLTQELLFAFADIPLSSNIKNDFASIKLDRGMNYYETPLAWARLILDGFSPLTMQGKNNAFSLLFPMEAVFESYVASILRKQVPDGLRLKTQASSKYLVKHKGKYRFQLQPDLLLHHASGEKKGQNACVLDTKWKLVSDNSEADEKAKYGLSQSDFYQMFAYGHKYLNGEGELFLIYPSHDGFNEAIKHSFDFDDNERLRLWVVPFDISASVINDDERLKLPEGSILKTVFTPSTQAGVG
ncbi:MULTISPECIES: McrC family protein [Colwellia]|uniref:McrBC 5-methylcytosine restriction system component family protein n=2 Tax=Colwellia TaxID=28228 RepID=A0ABQ0MZ25_9GAMM|nr:MULTISPECIES: McrC family protein [Colwellia]GAW97617.1 mcrBC 5-methylcytosine restriction system component family protein [Colwellia marinimaniae]